MIIFPLLKIFHPLKNIWGFHQDVWEAGCHNSVPDCSSVINLFLTWTSSDYYYYHPTIIRLLISRYYCSGSCWPDGNRIIQRELIKIDQIDKLIEEIQLKAS